jgi:heme exporter protein D
MSPEVTAVWIAAGVGVLTVAVTVVAQYFSRRATSRDTHRALAQQSEHLDRTLTEQREQLDKTLAEQRTRTLNERFAAAAGQLGSDKPPEVRLAGVYAMAGLADDWAENRQTCVDVLCGYLRMPYEPDPGEEAPGPERLAFRASREVRHTVIRVITAHLQGDTAGEWQGLDFDFTGVVFDGGDFTGAGFSGGTVSFDSARFSGGTVLFTGARFAGAEVGFNDARFSGAEVVFDLSEFSEGTLDFTGAQFSGGTVDFLTAQFSGGEVDFSGAGDWSSPPAFSWGRTGTPARSVKLPKKEDQTGGQEQATTGR